MSSEYRDLSLDDIVQDVISEEQLDSRDELRLLGLAVRGFYYIYQYAAEEVKSVLLPWTDTNLRYIDFPIDYSEWRKVGVLVPTTSGDYVVMTLSVNESLKLPQQSDIVAASCTCDSTDTVSGDSTLISAGMMPYSEYWMFRNMIRGQQIVGEVYGAGGGMSTWGAFREDTMNERFVFSSDVSTSTGILLEYKANMLQNKSRTVVPWNMREALIAWVKWKMLNKRNSNLSERDFAAQEFHNAYTDYHSKQFAMTKWEILDRLYRGLNFKV